MFFNRTATRHRHTVTDWTNGSPTKSTSTKQIEYSERGPTTSEIKRQEEGNEKKEMKAISTRADVRTADSADNSEAPADDIEIDGKMYQVTKVNERDTFLPHKEVTLVRKQD